MSKRWFEIALSILTNRERAAEITGDLLEQHTAGPRFWLQATRVLVALTWRPLLGVVGASVVCYAPAIAFGHSWQLAGHPMAATRWQMFAFAAASYSMSAWAIACIALVKLGFRNATSALACSLAGLMTFASCELANPFAQVIAATGFLAIVMLSLLSRANRARVGMLARSAFTIWLIGTAADTGYAALWRVHKLSSRSNLWMPLTCQLLSFAAGWIALQNGSKHTSNHEAEIEGAANA